MSMCLALWLAQAAFAQDAGGVGTTSMGGQDFYVIQPGDTLWDISQRFLGDAQAWPGLWSINDYITNPHWIYPGNRIYFHLGDDLNPPGVGLEQDKGDGYQPPPSKVENVEPLCDFPPRFEDARRAVKLVAPGVLSTARDLNIRGEVFGSEAVGREIGEGDFVYLHMDDAEKMDCGTIVALYRRNDTDVSGGGSVYRILGDARVIRVDGDTVTAQLRDLTAEIERGDLVGDPTPFRMRLDIAKPDGDLRANIIARLTADQFLAGDQETVFLDRGTDDGIDVGTTMYVIEQHDGQQIFDLQDDERFPERVIGRVVVVRAEESRATAVVVDAYRELESGMQLASNPNAKDD